MDLEQRLRASLVAPDPGPTFTARVMARVGRGAARRRSSFIVISAVLVASAAAAMVAWQMSAVQPSPVASATIPAVSDPGPIAEVSGQGLSEVREPVAATPKPKPAQAGDKSPRYSVLVMPLRQEAQDVSTRGPVEAFYAAVLDELREVPGLALYEQGESERVGGGQADFVLTITSLASRVSQSGGLVVRSTDGGTSYTLLDGGVVLTSRTGGGGTATGGGFNGGDSGDPASALWMEMKVESGKASASRHADSTYGSGAVQGVVDVGVVNLVLNNRLSGFNVDMDYGSNAAGNDASSIKPTPPATPVQAAAPRVEVLRLQRSPADATHQQLCIAPTAVRPQECMTPAQLAATQIQNLRLQVFPPDAAFQQRVLAQKGSASLDQAGGLKFLQDFLQGMTGDGGSRLDAGTIQALSRFAAVQPERPRLYIWNALRPVSHPALVAPLVESLRHDADRQVRLAALANLEVNYSANPVVRSALEGLDREDTDEIVRAAVRRVLYGQEQWRDEILAALHDTNLPYEARLAPLLANGLTVSARQQGQRRAALQEQQVLRPVTALIREQLRDPEHAKVTSEVLGLLGGVDDPVVFDLFTPLMRDTSMLDREISVRGNAIGASGPITGWVANHRNDPRVVASLLDADPRLRTLFEQMGRPAPLVALPVSGDEAVIPSNLIQRMREVLEKAAPPPPRPQ